MSSVLVPLTQPTQSSQEVLPGSLAAIIPLFLLQFGFSTRSTYAARLRKILGVLPSMLVTSAPAAAALTNANVIMLGRRVDEQAGVALATRKLEINTLRSLLKFCAEAGHLPADLGFLLRRMAAGAVPNRVSAPAMTIDQVCAVLKSTRDACMPYDEFSELLPEKQMRSPHYSRAHDAFLTRTLMALLLTMGLRASEACDLCLGDFQVSSRQYVLRLRVKGGGEDLRVVSRAVGLLLEDWIAVFRKPVTTASAAPLFPARALGGEPLSRFAVRRLVQRVASEAGVDIEGLTAHSVRATVAAILHHQGEPLTAIADLLGHRSIETTARYARSGQSTDSLAEKLPYASRILTP